MTLCFFVSDLHGHVDHYRKLFGLIEQERPAALFMGGDILPSGLATLAAVNFTHRDFINDFLVAELTRLRERLEESYPRVFVILGNDDGRFEEAAVLDVADVATRGLWDYAHDRRVAFGKYQVYGYAYIPPSPVQLKDWERYDVSRYVDPGCISPEEGMRTVPVSKHELRYATIAKDLKQLAGGDDMTRAVFLFHTPPYRTKLDRAALHGKMIDHAPMDVHVGSIAVREFIEVRQPLVTLHGHAHESVRLTGSWLDQIGHTFCFSAAHDGSELAIVRFDPEHPESATRELI